MYNNIFVSTGPTFKYNMITPSIVESKNNFGCATVTIDNGI